MFALQYMKRKQNKTKKHTKKQKQKWTTLDEISYPGPNLLVRSRSLVTHTESLNMYRLTEPLRIKKKETFVCNQPEYRCSLIKA